MFIKIYVHIFMLKFNDVKELNIVYILGEIKKINVTHIIYNQIIGNLLIR